MLPWRRQERAGEGQSFRKSQNHNPQPLFGLSAELSRMKASKWLAICNDVLWRFRFTQKTPRCPQTQRRVLTDAHLRRYLLPMPLCNFTRRKTLHEAKPDLDSSSHCESCWCNATVSQATEASGLPGRSPSMHSSPRNTFLCETKTQVAWGFVCESSVNCSTGGKASSKRTNTTTFRSSLSQTQAC